MNRWYFQHAGREVGPYSPDRLVSIATAGGIDRHTLVRKGDTGRWIPACRVAGLLTDESADSTWLRIDKPEAPVLAEAVHERRRSRRYENERAKRIIALASVGLVLVILGTIWVNKLRGDQQLQQSRDEMMAKFSVALWLRNPDNLRFGSIHGTKVYYLPDDFVGDASRSDYRCSDDRLVMGHVQYTAPSGEQRDIAFVAHHNHVTGKLTCLAPGAEDRVERDIRDGFSKGMTLFGRKFKSVSLAEPTADEREREAERRAAIYSALLQTLSYRASPVW